jgi:hypothetical protein
MDVAIECICPPKADGERRHEQDTVTLRDTLDFRTATLLRQTVKWLKTEQPDSSVPEVLATLTEAYLLHCIESWSLVDEKGKPVPPAREQIRDRLLTNDDAASTVGDAADGMYHERVLLPLLVQAQTSSPSTPTNGSTSARTGSGPKPQKPSKPSSTTTSPMVVTGPMPTSPGGVSYSSPSSASAR